MSQKAVAAKLEVTVRTVYTYDYWLLPLRRNARCKLYVAGEVALYSKTAWLELAQMQYDRIGSWPQWFQARLRGDARTAA